MCYFLSFHCMSWVMMALYVMYSHTYTIFGSCQTFVEVKRVLYFRNSPWYPFITSVWFLTKIRFFYKVSLCEGNKMGFCVFRYTSILWGSTFMYFQNYYSSSSSSEVHSSVSLSIIELVICTFTDKEACD